MDIPTRPVVSEEKANTFLDKCVEAYREMWALHSEAEIGFDLQIHLTGTVQLTMKLPDENFRSLYRMQAVRNGTIVRIMVDNG